jgi:hypothetical protein
MSDAISKVY